MSGHKPDAQQVQDTSLLSCLSEYELKKRLHKAARAELNEQLLEGECPVIIIEGMSSSAMIVTNQHRVLVFKKGMLSGVAFGRKMHSWDFSEIEDVRVDVRIMNGLVALETDELSAERLSHWGSDDSDSWKAPNAVPIDKWLEKQAREGAAKLRTMLHRYHNPDKSVTSDQRSPNRRPESPFEAPQPGRVPPAEAATSLPKSFCFACGAQLHPEAAFCGACGQKVV
jgi:hypothetical protein